MSIGHSPHVGPHVPDMKKDEANITEGERQEARRRIEGSLAPDRDNNIDMSHDDMDVADAAASGGFSAHHPANLQ